jgi:hypothetical protein
VIDTGGVVNKSSRSARISTLHVESPYNPDGMKNQLYRQDNMSHRPCYDADFEKGNVKFPQN